MRTIPVSAKRDHIEAMVVTKRPILAVAELIWNALDADAHIVEVEFELNAISGIDTITVSDNGHGIRFDEAELAFGNLGGSWKVQAKKSTLGRSLHGKSGKGRFRAFALGGRVVWATSYKSDDTLFEYTVVGSANTLESFELSEPKKSSRTTTGTQVRVTQISKALPSLLSSEASDELTEQFAIYLAEYKDAQIKYNGLLIDPASAQAHRADYDLGEVVLPDGEKTTATLTLIEWKMPEKRTLYLCDEQGISLHQSAPGIHAPGFSFTAYLKSPTIRELDKQNLLIVEELHPSLNKLLTVAKCKMREHFRQRSAEMAAALVKEWQVQNIYPYEGEPKGAIEKAERQVFDIVAVSVNDYLSDFESSSQSNKRFTLSLLKQSLRENPKSLQRIFEDVLKLPKEHQDDLAELLERTTFPAIITAAKEVADRLNFLKGLEVLVFDKEFKTHLKERQHLHKIIERETWIFGEQYHLTNSDESLTTVLRKHYKKLGRELSDTSEVIRGDGRELVLQHHITRHHPDT